MTDDRELARELETIAVQVATEAAQYVASNRPDFATTSSKTTATDLVTDVDKATEALLVGSLRRLRPRDAILGEEGGVHRAGDGSTGFDREAVQWVVDPIDGTVNFVLGLPSFSVSVAAQRAGRTLAGCVVDVSRRETFHASLDGGSRLSRPGHADLRLTGPRTVPLDEAVIGTGFGYDAGMRARQGRVLAELIGKIGNVRRLGSAAMDLCYVGAGRLDGYFEAGLNEWDRAAGMLIASEAGARVGTLSAPGSDVTVAGADVTLAGADVTLAGGATTFEEFKSLLVALGAHTVLAVD